MGIISIQESPNSSKYLHEESLKEFALSRYPHQNSKQIGTKNFPFFCTNQSKATLAARGVDRLNNKFFIRFF